MILPESSVAHPWEIAVCHPPKPSDVKLDILCKGAIVDKKWVTIPAHCVQGKSPAAINVAVGVNVDLDIATVSDNVFTIEES